MFVGIGVALLLRVMVGLLEVDGPSSRQVEQDIIVVLPVVDVERVVAAVDEFQPLSDVVQPHAAILVAGAPLVLRQWKSSRPSFFSMSMSMIDGLS